MSAHTPTPWHASGQMIAAENGFRVAEVSSPDSRARGKERREDWEFCRGNTEFIVRACNNHDALVRLLKEASVTLKMWADVAPAVSLIKDIDAALTAAGAI